MDKLRGWGGSSNSAASKCASRTQISVHVMCQRFLNGELRAICLSQQPDCCKLLRQEYGAQQMPRHPRYVQRPHHKQLLHLVTQVPVLAGTHSGTIDATSLHLGQRQCAWFKPMVCTPSAHYYVFSERRGIARAPRNTNGVLSDFCSSPQMKGIDAAHKKIWEHTTGT